MDEAVRFVHILSAGALIGVAFTDLVLTELIRGSKDVALLRRLLDVAHRVKHLCDAMLLLVLVTGIALARQMGLAWTTGWLVAVVVLYVISGGLLAMIDKQRRVLRRDLDLDGGHEHVFATLSARATVVRSLVSSAVIYLLLAIMIWRPGS